MSIPYTILVVREDHADRLLEQHLIDRSGRPYQALIVDSLAEGLALLQHTPVDAVLLDRIPVEDTVRGIVGRPLAPPLIVLGHPGDEEALAAALDAGADDYLFKDPGGRFLKLLSLTIERAVQRRQAAAARPCPQPHDVVVADLALVLDALPVGVMIAAPHLPNTPVLYVNVAFEQLTGYRLAQIRGKNARFLQGPATSPATLAEIRHCLRTRRPFAGEILNYRADGQTFWNDLRIAPVFTPTGALHSFVAVQADVTDRKRDAEALYRSEERFQTLARISPVGIFRTDPAGLCVYVNERWCEIAGIGAEQAYGQGWIAALYLDDRALIAEEWERSIREQISFQIECRFARPDGQITWVLGQSIAEYDPDGRMIGYVGTITDITALKQAEIDLAAERALLVQRVAERTADLSAVNAELAKTARAKDAFLASMSHELRTPLTAILGLSEVLIEEMSGPINQQQRESLLTIEQSGHHLLDLINDILDLSKIEAGQLDLLIEEVPIDQICEMSLLFIRQQSIAKQIGVTFTIDPPALVMQTDARRVKQILVNLLSNAVKFTPEHGQVGLEVRSEGAGALVYFSVWDTGIGIAPEDLEQVLQPFVQLDRKLSRQYEGTGLGLSLVVRLTHLLGGSLTIESEPGQGSRFSVRLPIDGPRALTLPASAPPIVMAPSASAALRGRHVLLAEDNQAMVNLLMIYLDFLGLRLSIAQSGVEAISMARELQPDLILMDIQMPDSDGLTAIAAIRAEPTCTTIPIIALTALVMPGDRERCLRAGAQDYLGKPLNLAKLRRALEEQLIVV